MVEDFYNRKFGNLTTICKYADKKHVRWICKCSCGKFSDVRQDSLKNIKNGCTHKIPEKYSGMTIGDITFISKDLGNNDVWNCKCSCGNSFKKSYSKIIRDKSLNCLDKNNHNLIGVKNGSYTCIKDFITKDCDKSNRFFVQTICECGSLKNIDRGIFISENISRNCDCSRDTFYMRDYLFNTYIGIKQRCYNKNTKRYSNYGGRGIFLYKDWINSFDLFKKYILENLGERPSKHSLDRIDNNNGYIPGNLKWSTYSQQNYNKGY